MKKWFMMFNILTLLVLTACQGSKETIVEKHYVDSNGNSLPVPPSGYDGGSNPGGGGNGVGNKSLEDWHVDLGKVPAFKRVKANVIDKLAVRFPRLAGDLTHISEARAWYFIPTQLQRLKGFQIGASFQTDQIALQKKEAIWINDLLFSAMAPENQDTLILHELVMGVRILEFANNFDRCLAGIVYLKLSPETKNKYDDERDDCFTRFRAAAELGDSVGLDKTLKLSDYDYDTVRLITELLMTKVDDFDVKELESLMVIRGFRKY